MTWRGELDNGVPCLLEGEMHACVWMLEASCFLRSDGCDFQESIREKALAEFDMCGQR